MTQPIRNPNAGSACAGPRPEQGRRQRAPTTGWKVSQGRDQVIPGEPAVLLHPARHPGDDLLADRDPEEFAPRDHADRHEPRDRQQQEHRDPPPPVEAFPARRRAAPPPRDDPRGGDQSQTHRPFQQHRHASKAQNAAAARREGFAPSSQKQNWHPTSDEREGRVGGRQLRLGDHDRRRRQDQAPRASRARAEQPTAERPDHQARARPGQRRDAAAPRTGCRPRRPPASASASKSESVSGNAVRR